MLRDGNVKACDRINDIIYSHESYFIKVLIFGFVLFIWIIQFALVKKKSHNLEAVFLDYSV